MVSWSIVCLHGLIYALCLCVAVLSFPIQPLVGGEHGCRRVKDKKIVCQFPYFGPDFTNRCDSYKYMKDFFPEVGSEETSMMI